MKFSSLEFTAIKKTNNILRRYGKNVNCYSLSGKLVDNLTNEEHVDYKRKEVPCKYLKSAPRNFYLFL